MKTEECTYCHRVLYSGDITKDHLIPESRGGKKFGRKNIVVACLRCNTVASDLVSEHELLAMQARGLYKRKKHKELRVKILKIKKELILERGMPLDYPN